MDNSYGYKLYNEADSFFSWHETAEDAAKRQDYERSVFGRVFQIAKMEEREYRAYPAHVREAAEAGREAGFSRPLVTLLIAAVLALAVFSFRPASAAKTDANNQLRLTAIRVARQTVQCNHEAATTYQRVLGGSALLGQLEGRDIPTDANAEKAAFTECMAVQHVQECEEFVQCPDWRTF
jgi:hypothetical protein